MWIYLFKALKEWIVVQYIREADPLTYGQTFLEICLCKDDDMLCEALMDDFFIKV